jgi:poly(A) polymerase
VRFRYAVTKNGKLEKEALVYTQEEHGIDESLVDPDAVMIIGRLKRAGFDAYIVGGAVRDLMLGKTPKDFDIVTSALPREIKRVFRNARVIGRRFQLTHVFFDSMGREKIIEVATFRSVKNGSIGNEFGTIEEDVLRRDFSLNALFYDPLEKTVIDYVGGVQDIRERKIRPIIPLNRIFVEDPVRMIRAVKYGAQTGFPLPWRLRRRIREDAGLLADVSDSRLTEEMNKILHSNAAATVITSLEATGLYKYLQPGASDLLKTDNAFREKYLAGFSALADGRERPDHERLAALVRPYLEAQVDFAAFNIEDYRQTWLLARHFVLPMNPPRFELDLAVKTVFAEHGITITFSPFRRPTNGPRSDNPPPKGTGDSPVSPGKPAKKHRKRHKRQAKKTKLEMKLDVKPETKEEDTLQR